MTRLIRGLVFTAISVMLVIVGVIVSAPRIIVHLAAMPFAAVFCPSYLPVCLHGLQGYKKIYKALLSKTVEMFKLSFRGCSKNI